jgi:hypothetical protein
MACTADVRIVDRWASGYRAELTVSAAVPVSTWQVVVPAGSGQSVTLAWNGSARVLDGSVVASGGPVSAGETAVVGFGGEAEGAVSLGQPVCTAD